MAAATTCCHMQHLLPAHHTWSTMHRDVQPVKFDCRIVSTIAHFACRSISEKAMQQSRDVFKPIDQSIKKETQQKADSTCILHYYYLVHGRTPQDTT